MHIYYSTTEQINNNLFIINNRKKNLLMFYLKKKNNELIINQTQKLHQIKRSIQKIKEKPFVKKNETRFSVLRSPHVFKKAQEHFKKTSYTKTDLFESDKRFLLNKHLEKTFKTIFIITFLQAHTNSHTRIRTTKSDFMTI